MSDGIWQTVLAQARLPRFALIQIALSANNRG